MATDVRWERMTAPELKALARQPEALVVLPVGSLEQHGPHLPVWTDSYCAHAFAVRAAEQAGVPVAVRPPSRHILTWEALTAAPIPIRRHSPSMTLLPGPLRPRSPAPRSNPRQPSSAIRPPNVARVVPRTPVPCATPLMTRFPRGSNAHPIPQSCMSS